LFLIRDQRIWANKSVEKKKFSESTHGDILSISRKEKVLPQIKIAVEVLAKRVVGRLPHEGFDLTKKKENLGRAEEGEGSGVLTAA